jgi:hypothetical protein
VAKPSASRRFCRERFSPCLFLPSPASIQYATFYATTSKRTLTATTGQKDSNPERASQTMGRLNVKVVPGSSRNQIVGWLGHALKIRVTAPPEKGKANEAVIDLVVSRRA